MVVNVGMPHTEIGWESVQMEDTGLITDEGCECLSTADFSIRIGPLHASTYIGPQHAIARSDRLC